MAYFPFMVEIEDKNCLVAGGGKIAFHKAKILQEFGVQIKVVAKEICPELLEFPCEFERREFEDRDIEGMDFVVAATDDAALNIHISEVCRQKNIPVNAVDMKDACSFIFPAMIQQKDLLVAVSTGGQSPAAAAYVKGKIKEGIPEYYGDMIETLGSYRELVLDEVDTPAKRKQVFNCLLEYGDSNNGEITEKKVYEVMEEVMNPKKRIRIGTRGSELALAQTKQVIARLEEHYPEWKIETVILHTTGDKILEKPLVDFGGKAVFVTEFEEKLMCGEIDLAVHSAKDMPMELADGLIIAGVLPRADARDVLVTKKGVLERLAQISGQTGAEKPIGMDEAAIRIGTGSLRRQFQLKAVYPNVECVSIRGNVPTRLDKIRQGTCDGVVLAAAGLERLGLLEEADLDYRYFSYEEMIPAGGQGIIAIEGRETDAITEMVKGISDQRTEFVLETERKVLELLNADCHEAIGVFSEVEQDTMKLQVIRENAGKVCRGQKTAEVDDWLEMAGELVKELQQ